MFKNKYISILVVLFSLALVVAAGYFAYVQFFKTSDGVAYKQSNSSETNSDSVALNGADSTGASAGNLSVDDSQQFSANLGSGSASSNSTSAPPKEDFAQYEQYKDATSVYFGDIQVGNGAVAEQGKQVAVTYKGYLTSGKLFDQSQKGDNGSLQPLVFGMGAGQLIAGFEQGVNDMKVGGVRRVIIPPSLGYGDAAQGPIPPNSVLVFDITLVAVQ